MKRIALPLVAAAIACGFQAQAQVVQTSAGAVQGETKGDVASFKGIPYAAPPVGANRWRPPAPVKPWTGTRDATKFGNDCVQITFPGAPSSGAAQSEDCLFVNVWRPADAKPDAKLPVMVWIHGGAFLFGSGGQPTYAGDQLARQDVVVVSLNYRLGRFGFFAFPALSKEARGVPTGNYAYMDQIAALKWVQQNIAGFGGDPANVTIFGESAGGVSVHSLLTIPSAKGLFHKAIIESGGGRDGTLTGRPLARDNADPNYPLSAETIGVNYARHHGIEGTNAKALAKLRALPADQILDKGQETAGKDGPRTYGGPVVDGVIVTETAQSAYAAGRQTIVPLMIGSNSAEVPAGFIAANSKESLFEGFGKGKAAAMAAYDPDGKTDLATLLTMANTDRVWAEPARLTAIAYAEKGAPAFVYRFSYVADSMKAQAKAGAPHASELEYVFDTLASRYGDKVTDNDRAVARMVSTYWANFARTGDPSGPGLARWPRYDRESQKILDVRPEGWAETGPDPQRARLDAAEMSGGAVIPR